MSTASVSLHDLDVYERGVPHEFFAEPRRASQLYWQPEDPPGRGFWAVTIPGCSTSPGIRITFGGGGPHFCLGDYLARLELHILFATLAERVPDVALAGPVRRLRSNFINGIKEMPVRLR